MPFLSEKSHDEESASGTFWFVEFCEKSGTSKGTAMRWWGEFTKETGLNITPKHATENNKQQFFDWLEAQKRKADEERVERDRKEQEDRDRRERETIERKQNEDAQEAILFLSRLAEDWGINWVEERVITTWKEEQSKLLNPTAP